MIIGDLIAYDNKTWIVRKIDSLGAALIEATDGAFATVGEEFQGCQIIAKPLTEWPSILCPIRVSRLVEIRSPSRTLVRLEEWLKLDEFQMGGALYFNPSLGLRYRDRLVGVFQSASGKAYTVPLNIPIDFLSLASRQAKLEAARVVKTVKTGPKTLFDFMLEDDD